MENLIGLVIVVLCVTCSQVFSENQNSRAGKFLNFFQIVTFKNQQCTTKDGSDEATGVCYSAWECSNRGGEEKGNCASGFGRCCVIANVEDK